MINKQLMNPNNQGGFPNQGFGMQGNAGGQAYPGGPGAMNFNMGMPGMNMGVNMSTDPHGNANFSMGMPGFPPGMGMNMQFSGQPGMGGMHGQPFDHSAQHGSAHGFGHGGMGPGGMPPGGMGHGGMPHGGMPHGGMGMGAGAQGGMGMSNPMGGQGGFANPNFGQQNPSQPPNLPVKKELVADKVVDDKSGMSSDYIQRVFNHLEKDGKGISVEQLVKFLKNASFASEQNKILDKVGPHVQGLTTEGMVSIVKTLSMSSEKVNAVKHLGKYLPKINETDKDTICAAFSFDSDKKAARAALDAR